MAKLSQEADRELTENPRIGPQSQQTTEAALFAVGKAICFEIAALRESLNELRSALPPIGPGGSFGPGGKSD